MSEIEIRNIIENAQEITTDDVISTPQPLIKQLPPASTYPVNLLGKTMASAAMAIRSKIQAPAAICAQSVLATAALATQAHGDVVLHTGQVRPSSEYFLTVASSSERKTSADTEAQRGVAAYEAELRDKYGDDLLEYENEKEAMERQRNQILSDKARYPSKEAKKLALKELGELPSMPLFPALTCTEPTFEGLCKLLAVGHPSIAVMSSEGGQFIGGHGMNEENRLKTSSAMSLLWDGQPIVRVRSGEGASVMPGRRLSMHLMLQPVIFNEFHSDRRINDQGLFSRCLIAAPESEAGRRFFKEPSLHDEEIIQNFSQRTLNIFRAPVTKVAGRKCELSPPRLKLSTQAKVSIIKFSDLVEAGLAEDGIYHSIKAFAGKLAEHAVRLATIKTLFDDLRASEIGAQDMEEAIGLASYYAEEALRLRNIQSINPTVMLAEKARVWMIGKWDEPFISLPDFYQLGPYGIEDAATARKVVTILETEGWLIRELGGAKVKGKKRRHAWRIVRC